jgi:glycosyltransferase involved in cell wall biosynthesis
MKNEKTVMKIGYILTTFPSRTETFAAREIEGLRKLGFVIAVFAAKRHEQPHKYAEATKVYYRPSLFSKEAFLSIGYLFVRYPLALGRLLCLVLTVLRECPRDAVSLIANLHTIGLFARYLDRESISHIHSYFLSWPSVVGLGLSAATSRSFSISSHARDIFVEQGAIKLKISRAKFVTTCTQQGLKHLKANLPAQYHHKLHLCCHGIRIVSECFEHGDKNIFESEGNDIIVAVGRMVQKKGFSELLKAFALVVQKKPNCGLKIVGNGPGQKHLIELIEQLALNDHVELMGWQISDVTLQVIRQATVLVAPSLIADDGDRDGIPNVILEAFASGTPVIASKLEGISEVVENRKTGLLVQPGDITTLSLAINRLLNNKYLQYRLSQMAYQTVVQRFDSAKNTTQLANLFINAS